MPRSERLELRLTDAEKAVWDAAADAAPLRRQMKARAGVKPGTASDSISAPCSIASTGLMQSVPRRTTFSTT